MSDQFDRWLDAELVTSLSQTGAEPGPTEPTYKRLQRRAAAGSAARRRIWHRPVTRLGVVVMVSGALLAGGTAAAAVHVLGPALGNQSSSGLTTPRGTCQSPTVSPTAGPSSEATAGCQSPGAKGGVGRGSPHKTPGSHRASPSSSSSKTHPTGSPTHPGRAEHSPHPAHPTHPPTPTHSGGNGNAGSAGHSGKG